MAALKTSSTGIEREFYQVNLRLAIATLPSN